MNSTQAWCAAALMAAVTVVGAQVQSQPAQSGQGQAAQPPQQQRPAQGQRGRGGRGGWQGEMDEARARQLYVSNDHADHGRNVNFEAQIRRKAETDRRYAEVTKGVVDFQKVSYRSSVGDLDIPAYLFQPLNKRGAKGHAAMVWVHGGVHGDWGTIYLPFVKEAIERGYVIIAPEYRGSTGYGAEHYLAIDYGAPYGTKVVSVADGTVVSAGWAGGVPGDELRLPTGAKLPRGAPGVGSDHRRGVNGLCR